MERIDLHDSVCVACKGNFETNTNLITHWPFYSQLCRCTRTHSCLVRIFDPRVRLPVQCVASCVLVRSNWSEHPCAGMSEGLKICGCEWDPTWDPKI